MAKFISEAKAYDIAAVLFASFGNSPAENFLRGELERYLPELRKATSEEINAFADYQRAVYLEGKVPELGRPIASLNPTFIDSLDDIVLTDSANDAAFADTAANIYTRASTKENGYRFQLHNGPQRGAAFHDVRAFTRQFKAYDLRMFPELHHLFKKLPVMIGDAELINAHYPHLAGFHHLQKRIPAAPGFWPKGKEEQIDEEQLQAYLKDKKIFLRGGKRESADSLVASVSLQQPKRDMAVTLAFHGMFAISHPDTWNSSVEEQQESMISFCKLPINYQEVDKILDKLAEHMKEKKLLTRVVQRKKIVAKSDLEAMVKEHEEAELEGICVVQYRENDFTVAKSVKIKRYEPVDTLLLGLYLQRKADKFTEANITGALLGLYDKKLDRYVPALKVNLDPEGVQVKTNGQKQRLRELRRALCEEVKSAGKTEAEEEHRPVTLYDAFLFHGSALLQKILSSKIAEQVPEALAELPRGKDLMSLYETFQEQQEEFASGKRGMKKSSTKTDIFLYQHQELFQSLIAVTEKKRKMFLEYFSHAKEVQEVSRKFVMPQLVVDLSKPIVLETQIFDVKRGKVPYAAGFDAEERTSFHFNNAFAERIRYDKSATTEYKTIEKLVGRNTGEGNI